jgi:hypothetical protein
MLYSFLVLGLYAQKLSFTICSHRSRCLGNELNRPVFGEFRMMGSKGHLRSLSNRSGDKVIPSQLPSRRWFASRSCRFAATGIIYARTTRSPSRATLVSDGNTRAAYVLRLSFWLIPCFLSLIPSDASSRFFETQ